MKQLTKEQAIELAKSGKIDNLTDEEIVKFQLYQSRLAMKFSRFHEAIERVLGRPVFTHEFARADLLQAEYEKIRPTPTLEEILSLIPEGINTILAIH